jgi:hypothetical protein
MRYSKSAVEASHQVLWDKDFDRRNTPVKLTRTKDVAEIVDAAHLKI